MPAHCTSLRRGAILALAGAAVLHTAAQAQSRQTVQAVTLPQLRAIERAKPAPGSPALKLDGDVEAVVKRAAGHPDLGAAPVSLDILTQPNASLDGVIKDLQVDAANSDPAAGKFRATAPAAAIADLAKAPQVTRIRLQERGRSNAGGGYATEGLKALGLQDPAFLQRGLRGQGVKVCVISDSVNYHYELPEAKSLDAVGKSLHVEWDSLDPASNDEGLAMLEVVHAVAPDAQLHFAAGMDSEVQFRKAVEKFVSEDCDVIVDDIVFPSEPPFENGQTAKAVNKAAHGGVIFISAAGNHGNYRLKTSGVWEHAFASGGAAGLLYAGYGAGDLVRFDDIHTFNTIDHVAKGRAPVVDLFWADPWNAPQAKYDLFLIAGDNHPGKQNGAVVGHAVSAGAPEPHIRLTGAHQGDSVVILRVSGSTSPYLHLAVTDGSLRYPTKGNIRGHRASSEPAAFSVTAVPAGSAAYAKLPPKDIDRQDSDGPRHIFFDDDGHAFGEGSNTWREINKPDYAVAEGASTTLRGALGQFDGTSSSAAYAAGLTALALSCNPRPDIGRLRSAIVASALKVKTADPDEIGAGVLYAPDLIAAACGVPGAAAPQPPPPTGD